MNEKELLGSFYFFNPPLWLPAKNMLYLSLVQPIWFPPLPQKQGGRKSWFPLCLLFSGQWCFVVPVK